jgi:hypothetical protein
VKYYLYQGYKIRKDTTVWVPKKNEELPCEGSPKEVPVKVCIASKCKEFDPSTSGCEKYDQEHGVKHKPKPYRLSYALKTPSNGKRGFYGKKDIRDGSFV